MADEAPSTALAGALPARAPSHSGTRAPLGAPRRAPTPTPDLSTAASPLDALARLWRRTKGAPPIRLDDRGKPVAHVSFDTVADTLVDSSTSAQSVQVSRARWRWRIQGVISILVLFCVISVYVPSLRLGLPILMFGPLVFLSSIMQIRRGETVPFALRERIIAASLLRAGRCGGCGFAIRSLEAVDGLVTCPECGGEWQRDRWRVDKDDLDALASRAITFAFKADHAPSQVDDRGALLHEPMRARPRWLRNTADRLDDSHSPDMAALAIALRRARRTTTLWTLLPTSLFIIACATLISAASMPIVVISPFIALGVVLIAVVVVMVFRTGGVASADTRTLALTHSICPACGGHVDPNGPREFDGCVRCDQCASAWRYNSLGKPAQRHRTKATFSTINE